MPVTSAGPGQARRGRVTMDDERRSAAPSPPSSRAPQARSEPSDLPNEPVEETAMTRPDDRSTVQIHADGRVLAEAEVLPTDEPGVVHSELHVESGHLPA